MTGRNGFFGSAVVPFRLVFLMWLVFSVEVFFSVDLGYLGILPRTLRGLIGIFTAPLIHGSLAHITSNTVPLLFLGSVLFFFYDNVAQTVFFRCYFFTNALVWAFSPRVFYHIGASGLIYGLSAFLLFYGILKRDFLSLMISLAIFMLYGGIFYGVLPTDPHISWESHLAGAIVGTYTAFDLKTKS